jgi:hypothetical protein
MRFNHYTWGRSVPGIRAEGLKKSISEEKFAHGGTESPQVFATAGPPPERDLREAAHGDRHFIEGYAHLNQLDIGRPWGGQNMSEEQLGEHIRNTEANRSTITFQGDVPPEQIIAVHEPWHSTARYLASDPSMERSIVAGDYDDIEPSTDRALQVAKMGLAAKVMLGGKLGGKSYADDAAERAKKKT